MTIILGSDHGGYQIKQTIIEWLVKEQLEFRDLGCFSAEATDYSPIAQQVAEVIQHCPNSEDMGILICGTGIGMSIMANKVPGIRASVVHNTFTAQATREHNNSNILCLGARVLPSDQAALDIVKTWLNTPFLGGRHKQRIDYITNYESFKINKRGR
ncbi:ribose 5-phosphate isomerase B [Amphibacillus marinus]|uniref:Ribose 5-phosphate isomerase B n=1 Tax=Amphibacillus marinus TaxID=872970 RepID=A0A1H8PHY0_9BACI|nr:ribose 5-phosphate isomerase B [Amphibacillus marinus]SEO41317.1 ribose 5-phosphate isomerase B [Amphibacillus marinus]